MEKGADWSVRKTQMSKMCVNWSLDGGTDDEEYKK